MTMSATHAAESASPMRGLLPLWVGVGVYAVFLLAGNQLLIDPDTMWQITIGQWIVDHGAVPTTDVYSFTMRGQPWISTQWLAQVPMRRFPMRSPAGPGRWCWPRLHRRDLRAVLAVSQPALERKHDAGVRRGGAGADRAASVGAAACAGVAGDDGVGRRTGRLRDRRGAPSFWLLPLMTLWANLHGGFVLGLALVAPIALDAVWNADAALRKSLALRWALFAVAALIGELRARPMAGIRCWRRERFSISARRCR